MYYLFKITDNKGRITICNDDEFKEIRIYVWCNEYGHRKCEYIDKKNVNDLLQSLQNMLPFCLKCKKNTENVDPKMLKAKNSIAVLPSKCVICGSKRSRSIKEQKQKWIIKQFRY